MELPSVRVGTDVQPIEDVAAALSDFGDRYRDRIFSADELAGCDGTAESLAARFAAKEAVLKVLRTGDRAPDLRSIEIIRVGDRACRVRLSGEAADAADAAGLVEWDVSLSHGGGIATATVVASASRHA